MKKSSRISNANQQARGDIAVRVAQRLAKTQQSREDKMRRTGQAEPPPEPPASDKPESPAEQPAAPDIEIIDYINTVHESLDVQRVYNFANLAMSSGGNLTYLYPWGSHDEGVALIYSGGPANMEQLQRAVDEFVS